jgi:hypothetical protein
MRNPWLNLPLEDYEGHMNSPGVQQLGVLSELFHLALAIRRPASVAILGMAGGNGLEGIDKKLTKRVVGLDLNASYLREVGRRYPDLPSLELFCTDLAHQQVHLPPVDLVHAALVFEHAGVELCLHNAASLVASGGALSVVLQLPAETEPNVANTAFPSMQALRSHFSLVDPLWLRNAVETRGFQLIQETARSLPAAKSFWMGVFARS